MTSSLRLGLVALLAGLAVATARAQQVGRDGQAAIAHRSGTNVVAGLVTLGDDAATPVRRAVVTLTNTDGSDILAAITDDHGRFTIARVPAGRYMLAADKPAHLTTAYGAHGPGLRGTVVIVTNNQDLGEFKLSLPRGAVLAGRITFSNGQPASNVQMVAVPTWRATAGGTLPAGGRPFRTDDLGAYRLFGLSADTYVVAALPPFGTGEIERMTDTATSNVLTQLAQPDSPNSRSFGASTKVAYAPTYFPGTPSVGDATPIRVSAGQVREDLDFAIAYFPAATLRGRVAGVSGAPTQAVALSLEPIGPAFPAGATGAAEGSPNGNGEFQMAGISPGFYRLHARAGGARPTDADAQTQYATMDVQVSGNDMDGLLLVLQEGARFAGRLIADGSAAPRTWAGSAIIIQPVTVGPTDAAGGILTRSMPARKAEVDADGQFSVTGIEPFDYEIRVELPPALVTAGWHVESVRSGDMDVRDAPLTFRAGSIDGVSVRMTTAVTELRGRLTAESGAPAADYFVVAFPADRALWHATSPRVQVMRPALDGTFSTRDLPPGTYRLAVVTDIEAHQPKQREFLESIYKTSIEIRINAGGTTSQELRAGR